jgi:hypothetical protein
LSDERLRELLEVQEYFGLPSPAPVEKDFYVVKALAAIAAIDTAPLRLVFGGAIACSAATAQWRPTLRVCSVASRRTLWSPTRPTALITTRLGAIRPADRLMGATRRISCPYRATARR